MMTGGIAQVFCEHRLGRRRWGESGGDPPDAGRRGRSFDSSPGDANWLEAADLDGDGAVTVFDYNILSSNFDMAGD